MLTPRELATDAYLAEQDLLHLAPGGYGSNGGRWAESVIWLCRRFDCWSVLDYGCGEGSLKRRLESVRVKFAVREYDPAPVLGKNRPPEFADLVVCTDVLEHVEPHLLVNVLNHIQGLARKAILLCVDLERSNKVLSDGRNAHLILKPSAWWEAKVDEHHMRLVDAPDMPTPRKCQPGEKRWIAVLTP